MRPWQFPVRALAVLIVVAGPWIAHGQIAPAATWGLAEVTRIPGDGGGNVDAMLSDNGHLTVSRDGSVIFSQVSHIKVFDASGRFVRTVGRKGEGPGEFAHITNLGWLGDTLWVFDVVQQRVTLFSREWSVLSTFPTPRPELPNGVSSRFMSLIAGGKVLSARTDSRQRDLPVDVILHPRRGADASVVAQIPPERTATPVRLGTTTLHFPQIFGDDPLIVVSPNGGTTAVVERTVPRSPSSAAVTIRLHRLVGSTASMSVPYSPVRLTQQLVDSLLRSAAESITASMRSARFGVSADAMVEGAKKGLYVPAFFPPVAHALLADDGQLWLQWSPRGERWTIAGGDGVVAQLTAPRMFRAMHVRGQEVTGIETDQLGVPSIVKYRLVRP